MAQGNAMSSDTLSRLTNHPNLTESKET